MKFIIDKSKWRAGNISGNGIGKGPTRLLNEDGFMCCLGQIELQLGLTFDQILDKGKPHMVKIENILTKRKKTTLPEYSDSLLSKNAMSINDNSNLTTEQRITELTNLFSQHGHELVFEGEEVPYND